MIKAGMDILVKLLQLPVPEVERLYSDGNIPLAAGYLKAALLKKGLLRDEQVEIVDTHIVNSSGDMGIIDELLKGFPKVIGFTVYMWNIERTSILSAKVKELAPDTLVVWGGPEVQAGIGDTERFCDVFFVGEGEDIFAEFIEDILKGKEFDDFYIAKEPVELQNLHNPYIEGIITPAEGGAMLVETMRGCIYPCKYCFYSKSFKGLRYFPDSQLKEIFRIASKYKVSEIYLMDPSFNCSKDLNTKLKLMKELNINLIDIHTEIRLESVTEDIAQGLLEAGVRSVEVGLQSVNFEALNSVGRSWNREKFVRGGRILKSKGIDVKTGVIMGLPGESWEGFIQTIDFVIEEELEGAMEIYPLSILPGTTLKDSVEGFGIEYMDEPPYWVTSTDCLDENGIRYAIEVLEHKLDIDFHTPILPFFKNPGNGFIYFWDFRGVNCKDKLKEYFMDPQLTGNSFTFIVDNHFTLEDFIKLGDYLSSCYPSTLLQVILDYNKVPGAKVCDKLSQVFRVKGGYFDAIHYFKEDEQKSHSLRFFFLSKDLSIVEEETYCDIVIDYSAGMIENFREQLEAFPILLIPESIGTSERALLKELYKDFEGSLVFQ